VCAAPAAARGSGPATWRGVGRMLAPFVDQLPAG